MIPEKESDQIIVDGVSRSRLNSEGNIIDPDNAGLISFWQWFRDSPLVDRNKRPLVAYRGMTGDHIRLNSTTGLAHVALDKLTAESFSNGRAFHAVYVSAKLPFDFRNDDHLVPLLKAMAEEGMIARINEYRFQLHKTRALQPFDIQDISTELRLGAYAIYEIPIISEWIRNAGYDSIYMMEDDYANNPTVAVYNPGLIKSTSNKGIWDELDTKILHSKPRHEFDTSLLKAGQPAAFYFSRNTISSKTYNIQGVDVGRNLEPSGEYMNLDFAHPLTKPSDQWETGCIVFNNPLYLEHKSTDSKGWKKDLSELFQKKTGRKLTTALNAASYDGVVTYDEYGLCESLNIGGRKFGSMSDANNAIRAASTIRFIDETEVEQANKIKRKAKIKKGD